MGLSDADDKPIGVMFWYSDRIPGDELAWDKVELSVEGLSLKDPVLVDAVTAASSTCRCPTAAATEAV